MPGLSRRGGDGRGAVSPEEMPCSARDRDERDDRGDQRQEHRTFLRAVRLRLGRGFRFGGDAHSQRIDRIDLSMFLSCVGPRSVTAISSLPLT